MTNTRTLLAALAAGLAIVWTVPATGKAAATFQLREKEHIAIIGNTLAERMQYDGWLETMLHARFPKPERVVHNLRPTSRDPGQTGARLPRRP